jgi:hypothetical protein
MKRHPRSPFSESNRHQSNSSSPQNTILRRRAMIAASSTWFGGSVDGLQYLPSLGIRFSLCFFFTTSIVAVSTSASFCLRPVVLTAASGFRLVTLYWHFCLLHHAFIHFFICRFGIHSLFCCSCFWCWSTYWGPEPRGILGRQILDQEHHKQHLMPSLGSRRQPKLSRKLLRRFDDRYYPHRICERLP